MTRGGKREGAGRKKKDESEKREKVWFSCPGALAQALDARWQAQGFKDRSEYLRHLVQADLARGSQAMIE